ncbi:aminopeptidase P family protein [Chitinimonas koreensis]|uniref:aminopeptidase P family protein n=1 Tax=Chitinimonas koreensis TaxID=356302 RepID=UPI000423A80A|nr:aminopeptidase P family protein [Chitinimonas koreensis]QNM98409.1 aminopeptidase P family protein [Chitinimonas koreensis]
MNAPLHPAVARLAALREAMAAHGVAACIVPSADPHQSEYLPGRWHGRRWLSGFTGSVGTLVVTADQAGLWVDGRYWVQAEAELAGSGITLMKIAVATSLDHADWLARALAGQPGASVAVDGAVLGLAAGRVLRDALSANGIALRTGLDLLDAVWPDRPGLPDGAIRAHRQPHATVSRADKLGQIRAAMVRHGAGWHLLSSLDDIAWLLNLRGADVPYNPVFVSHLLLGRQSATLFVAAGKLDAGLVAELARDGVAVADYASVKPMLAALPADEAILLDPRRVAIGLAESVPAGMARIEAVNPSTLAKGCKTADEIAHVRATMEHDGAALCEAFAALERALAAGERMTELDVDRLLVAARARRPGFVGASFATIAGFNGNGAMPHYSASEASHAAIEGDGLLLVDSGGQYLGGTTDITRMLAIGQTRAEQRRDVTLVLKGMIGLSRAQFPAGTRSPQLDALARAPLWAEAVDYNHGTGHGVGYFLNVHEGPQVISPHAAPEPHTAMRAGMITSVEPGIYRAGQWGARIENLLLAVEAGSHGFGDFLRFETLTLCPIDRRCLEPALLRDDEIAWLDRYHAEVRQRLLPLVEGEARDWLLRHTAALGEK